MYTYTYIDTYVRIRISIHNLSYVAYIYTYTYIDTYHRCMVYYTQDLLRMYAWSAHVAGSNSYVDDDDCIPRETPPHTRTARAQPPAAHRRWHSRHHHRRHGEHSPTAQVTYTQVQGVASSYGRRRAAYTHKCRGSVQAGTGTG